MKKIITSESVNVGHPDKTCDVIADCFLDAALAQDANSQMAVECAIKNNKLFIYGEATTKAKINYNGIAKKILKYVGYDASKFKIVKEISCQSPDINSAAVKKKVTANDQGIMFGYACNETEECLPLGYVIANKLMEQYEKFRLTNKNYFADAKSQVSVEYVNNVPKKITTVLLSVSHSDSVSVTKVRTDIKKYVVDKVLIKYNAYVDSSICLLINAGGKFTIWGSFADSGCVGRKIVVDSYGGVARVGGGCFSSKNATKVDRSAAYYLRYVAKSLVSAGLVDRCELNISYGFGLSQPISFNIETFGTEKVGLEKLYKIVNNNFNFLPSNIIKELDLLKPIYAKTACYGHFGKPDYAWEQVKKLKI